MFGGGHGGGVGLERRGAAQAAMAWPGTSATCLLEPWRSVAHNARPVTETWKSDTKGVWRLVEGPCMAGGCHCIGRKERVPGWQGAGWGGVARAPTPLSPSPPRFLCRRRPASAAHGLPGACAGGADAGAPGNPGIQSHGAGPHRSLCRPHLPFEHRPFKHRPARDHRQALLLFLTRLHAVWLPAACGKGLGPPAAPVLRVQPTAPYPAPLSL